MTFGDLTSSSGGDQDSDGDGLTDAEEFAYWQETGLLLNPQSSDTDGDGIEDAQELDLGLSPTVRDAHLDNDNDGISNYLDLILGTDLNNWDSDGDGLSDGLELGIVTGGTGVPQWTHHPRRHHRRR